MTSDPLPEIYPQYCFDLSPTARIWCRLRASDVAALTTQPGFEGQSLFFHGNHPIKWVRIAGIIVAVDEYGTRRIYTVDDGSGVNIECVTTVPPRPKPPALFGVDSNNQLRQVATDKAADQPPPKQRIPADLNVGQVIDVKGGLELFRDQKQIKAECIAVLRSTRDEVAFWEKTTRLREEVLNRPWVLDRREVRRCRKKAETAGRRSKTSDKTTKKLHKGVTGLERTTGKEISAGAAGAEKMHKRATGLEWKIKREALVTLPKRATGLEKTSAPGGLVISKEQDTRLGKGVTSAITVVPKPHATGLEATSAADGRAAREEHTTGLERGAASFGTVVSANRITGLEKTSFLDGYKPSRPRERATGLERSTVSAGTVVSENRITGLEKGTRGGFGLSRMPAVSPDRSAAGTRKRPTGLEKGRVLDAPEVSSTRSTGLERSTQYALSPKRRNVGLEKSRASDFPEAQTRRMTGLEKSAVPTLSPRRQPTGLERGTRSTGADSSRPPRRITGLEKRQKRGAGPA